MQREKKEREKKKKKKKALDSTASGRTYSAVVLHPQTLPLESSDSTTTAVVQPAYDLSCITTIKNILTIFLFLFFYSCCLWLAIATVARDVELMYIYFLFWLHYILLTPFEYNNHTTE